MDLPALLDILTLRPLGEGPDTDRFEAISQADRPRNIFGGQLLAQALLAAGATVPAGRLPHSIHASFVRGGDTARPLRYDVERIRDGRSFSHRQVTVHQHDRELFRAIVSLHDAAPGPGYEAGDLASHDVATPVDPAGLPSYVTWAASGTDNPEHDFYRNPAPVELRYEDAPPEGHGVVVQGPQHLWTRVPGDLPDGQLLHIALVAWISDLTAADFTTLVHGRRWTDHDADSVSLDHAMWFLRPVRVDDWLRFTNECTSTGGGRGLTEGSFRTADGQLVARLVQEVVLTAPLTATTDNHREPGATP